MGARVQYEGEWRFAPLVLAMQYGPCDPARTQNIGRSPPQFGKYLDEKKRALWAPHYVDYKALKDLIKDCAAAAELVGRQ